MSLPSYLARRSFHYSWIVAGLTFLALLIAAGIRSAPGVLIVPLEHEFGWSMATISLAISINLVLYGLIGPFATTDPKHPLVRNEIARLLAVVRQFLHLRCQYEWTHWHSSHSCLYRPRHS